MLDPAVWDFRGCQSRAVFLKFFRGHLPRSYVEGAIHHQHKIRTTLACHLSLESCRLPRLNK
jgi:hypothetical protein